MKVIQGFAISIPDKESRPTSWMHTVRAPKGANVLGAMYIFGGDAIGVRMLVDPESPAVAHEFHIHDVDSRVYDSSASWVCNIEKDHQMYHIFHKEVNSD